jgi:hypothetical protein
MKGRESLRESTKPVVALPFSIVLPAPDATGVAAGKPVSFADPKWLGLKPEAILDAPRDGVIPMTLEL